MRWRHPVHRRDDRHWTARRGTQRGQRGALHCLAPSGAVGLDGSASRPRGGAATRSADQALESAQEIGIVRRRPEVDVIGHNRAGGRAVDAMNRWEERTDGSSRRAQATSVSGSALDVALGARPSIPVGRARGSCELQTRSAASRCRCASATTCDAVCGRNPHAPFGLRRRGAICRVAPPRRCAGASPRRRASQLAPRRSQRGLREYSDGLLAAARLNQRRLVVTPLRVSASARRRVAPAGSTAASLSSSPASVSISSSTSAWSRRSSRSSTAVA